MELFKIKDLVFKKEEFLDNISEFEDIILILQDMQNELTYDEIECVGENDCCNKTNKNYVVEIHGFINGEDEFITQEELEKGGVKIEGENLDLFVIRVYMCVQCGKWIIDILE